MPQALPIMQAIGTGLSLVNAVGAMGQGNQMGSQAQQNWANAPGYVYQPQFAGALDQQLMQRLTTPTVGESAVNQLLADIQNPQGRQGGAMTEAIRSSMADRGLSTSPLGAVMESQQMVPALSQATSALAGQSQGFHQQNIADLLNYIAQASGAGAQKGGLAMGAGQNQWGAGTQLGTAAGGVMDAGLRNVNQLIDIFSPNTALPNAARSGGRI